MSHTLQQSDASVLVKVEINDPYFHFPIRSCQIQKTEQLNKPA